MLDINVLRISRDFALRCRLLRVLPSRHLLLVSVASQRMAWLERTRKLASTSPCPSYVLRRVYVVSTSRFGTGQVAQSNRTPLGLHRIAARIGAGQPIGTVFEERRCVGLTWQGRPDAPIAHRILWLEGMEPGFNRGGKVDSFQRYIYIHGLGRELTLGRPASRGCIHLAASDLMPLFERIPVGTLVWIRQ